jgi:hypothetical protein
MIPGFEHFQHGMGHVIFLTLFFAVLLTIMTTVVAALWRTSRDFRAHRAVELCWESAFSELPESERHCRHELAGRVTSRMCDNNFDCRHCSEYSQFAALPAKLVVHDLKIHHSDDRYYHRGHSWVRREADGTLAVGLDELGQYLIGNPDSIEMPAVGGEIDTNGIAWRIKKNGKVISVRAPIEGRVVGIGGPGKDWYLKIQPRLDPREPRTLRHLLRGAEVPGWLYREQERLQAQLRPPNAAPSLADGGSLVHGLMNAIPEADWETVLEETFLEA